MMSRKRRTSGSEETGAFSEKRRADLQKAGKINFFI